MRRAKQHIPIHRQNSKRRQTRRLISGGVGTIAAAAALPPETEETMSSEWPMFIMQAAVLFLMAGCLFIKA
ncbi:hypothetical protein [Neorhizobium sp. SOG26]|uniref:hypothetical protein n=1 Tax=Neorhizobium sp. SOG26 TaxID=2060726 RepID=UPI00123788EA|nr:hypothetical protein [Neorhizobium sp. SOG26]